jgi:hypothetical protein
MKNGDFGATVQTSESETLRLEAKNWDLKIYLLV